MHGTQSLLSARLSMGRIELHKDGRRMTMELSMEIFSGFVKDRKTFEFRPSSMESS